jgi:two-component system cell cycle response regulator
MGSEVIDERRASGRSGVPPTVLVADDSSAIRRILRRALEGAGYRVTEAADGQQAVLSCRADRPDLLLLDIDMPVMDGLNALGALKADTELSSVPVLFLTARTAGSDVAAGLDLGAEDYLRKPCDPDELHARVANILRVKAREEELRRRALQADQLSTLDPLTGLGNRRYLELRISELVTAGGSMDVGVLLADIDHFKRVNDELGHPVGDEVLKAVASRLRAATGDGHILVRWGGEEFLVIAPDVTAVQLAEVAERCRAAVASAPFSTEAGTIVVTVSLGGTYGSLDRWDAAVRHADNALYAAKRAGRDQAVTWPLPTAASG